MNERIGKLFEQALEEFNAENKYATIIVPNPLKEKFAELIVRECARVAFESDLTMAIGQWGADSAILKHFGVEQ